MNYARKLSNREAATEVYSEMQRFLSKLTLGTGRIAFLLNVRLPSLAFESINGLMYLIVYTVAKLLMKGN